MILMSIILLLSQLHFLGEQKRFDLIVHISINSPAVVRSLSEHETLPPCVDNPGAPEDKIFLPNSKLMSY